jgi:hypothetical protein
MTLDNPEKPDDLRWLTLTEAAARTGHSREALRQRVRRGKLRAQKGNDGVMRVDAQALADLPPPESPGDDHAVSVDGMNDTVLDLLQVALDDLRVSLDREKSEHGRTRAALDKALDDRLDDHGRAERAEAQVKAEARRADEAERRLAATEAALAEARTPWTVRVLRALRGG